MEKCAFLRIYHSMLPSTGKWFEDQDREVGQERGAQRGRLDGFCLGLRPRGKRRHWLIQPMSPKLGFLLRRLEPKVL